MKTDLKNWLLKKYSLPETIFLMFALIGSVSLLAIFIGDTAYYVCGTIFIVIGIYGLILKLKQTKCQKQK